MNLIVARLGDLQSAPRVAEAGSAETISVVPMEAVKGGRIYGDANQWRSLIDGGAVGFYRCQAEALS